MKIILSALLLLTCASLKANLHPITSPPEVLVLIEIGQSNARGYAETARLANTNYTYKGIADGYPTVRSNQARYQTNPPNVYIYTQRPLVGDLDSYAYSIGGSWEPYSAATNACTPQNWLNTFGIELSCATRLSEYYGKEVFIIKCGLGGTALVPGTTTGKPGTWNNVNREIFKQYVLSPAVKSLRSIRPTSRLKIAGVIWYQGETDGVQLVQDSVYADALVECRSVIDSAIVSTIGGNSAYKWHLMALDHSRTANETNITAAISNQVTRFPESSVFIQTHYWPRKVNLTSAEAAPISVGSPNSTGYVDDSHGSHIRMLALGERVFEAIVASGIIK